MIALFPSKQRAFSLIELLIALTILAILAGISLAVFRDVQVSARDARRKQDLHNIQTALEVYYQKNKRYPCTDLGTGDTAMWQKSDGTTPFWIDDICDPEIVFDSTYITSLPHDPKNTAGLPWIGQELAYAYWSPTSSNDCSSGKGQYYILIARLENPGDRDTSPNKLVNYCDGELVLAKDQIIYDADGLLNIDDLYILTSQD